jgi:hypothetical protein
MECEPLFNSDDRPSPGMKEKATEAQAVKMVTWRMASVVWCWAASDGARGRSKACPQPLQVAEFRVKMESRGGPRRGTSQPVVRIVCGSPGYDAWGTSRNVACRTSPSTLSLELRGLHLNVGRA